MVHRTVSSAHSDTGTGDERAVQLGFGVAHGFGQR